MSDPAIFSGLFFEKDLIPCYCDPSEFEFVVDFDVCDNEEDPIQDRAVLDNVDCNQESFETYNNLENTIANDDIKSATNSVSDSCASHEDDDEDEEFDQMSDVAELDDDEDIGTRLKKRTKQPVLDALIASIRARSGAELLPWKGGKAPVQIYVTDLSRLLLAIQARCSKTNPTRDQSNRLKSIRRWFEGIPPLYWNGVTYRRKILVKNIPPFVMETRREKTPVFVATARAHGLL